MCIAGAPARAACLLFVLFALAGCSGGSNKTSTATPAATPPPTATTTAGAPTAAGITGTPRTAPAGTTAPVDASSAEAMLRRIVLFGTDLPPGYTETPATVEGPEAVAQRAADPSAFLKNAAAWSWIASSRSAFETSGNSANARFVRSAAIRCSGTEGATAMLAALQSDGIEPALAAIRAPGADPTFARLTARPLPPPPVGDEARAWTLFSEGSSGAPAGTLIAFRRGAVVGLIATIGGPDMPALAQALDGRAAAAQQR
jgi:hypothetical protein